MNEPESAETVAPKAPGPLPALANGSAEHAGLTDCLRALQAMRLGDFSVRMAGDAPGLLGKIADTFNDIAATNQHMAQQLEHLGQVVGKEGRTRQRLRIGLATGSWGGIEHSVNSLIDDLLWPTAEVTRVARELGTDGKLGGQAQVRKVTGMWKDLTESVNSMASNLTDQVRN